MEQKDIEYIINAHSNQAKKPSKAFRKFDGKTPYFYHPLWCATTIAAETSLEEKLRERGSIALLYHDLIEDTNAALPSWLEKQTVQDIKDMTFSNSEDEMQEIWKKPDYIKLFKIYDKTHNLLDGSWMNGEKRKKYQEYLEKLCTEVEKHYGKNLNITKIARTLTQQNQVHTSHGSELLGVSQKAERREEE